jgi:hypothetical protein
LVSQIGIPDLTAFISLHNITPMNTIGVPRGYVPGDTIAICNGDKCIDMVFGNIGGVSGFAPNMKRGLYDDPHTGYRNARDGSMWDGGSAMCLVFGVGCPGLGPSGNPYWIISFIYVKPLTGTVEIRDVAFPIEAPAPDGVDSGGVNDPAIPWGDTTIPMEFGGAGGPCLVCLDPTTW